MIRKPHILSHCFSHYARARLIVDARFARSLAYARSRSTRHQSPPSAQWKLRKIFSIENFQPENFPAKLGSGNARGLPDIHPRPDPSNLHEKLRFPGYRQGMEREIRYLMTEYGLGELQARRRLQQREILRRRLAGIRAATKYFDIRD